jgi:hypothetical protein
MRLRFVIITVCCFLTLAVQADEGMWMLGNLNKQTRRTMKELGLQMPADKLYSSKRPSLKDAVVSFGGRVGRRIGIYESSLRFQLCPATFFCGA